MLNIFLSGNERFERTSPQLPSTEAPQVLNIQNFESSHLRFEYDALLEEYRILWTEIQARNTDQQQIVNYALTLVTAFFAISQLFINNTSFQSSLQLLRPAYPLLTIMFSAFALLFHHHSTMMAHIGIYTNTELRPRMEKILAITNNNPQIWRWNEWRGQNQYRKFPGNLFEFGLSIAGYIITFAPGVFFTALFWVSRDPHQSMAIWERLLFVFSLSSIAWVTITGIYTALHFRRIGNINSRL